MSAAATSATDLSDLDLFAGGAPWEAFARLRSDAPVAWNPEAAPNHGFWSVGRHRDIVAVLSDEDQLIGNTDPEYADVLFDSAASAAYRDLPFRSLAALEVFAYGDELARQCRGGHGSDLVGKLINTVPEDGVP